MVAGLVVLASLPAAVGALPVGSSAVTATQLRHQILASSHTPYSGYAESRGGLSLPVTSQLTSLSDLLGGLTQLRVWYRGPQDLRVDQLSVAGEVDVHADADGLTTWNYESNLAQVDPPLTGDDVRLPQPADVLPSTLGLRVLSQATDAEVSRLPVERIAGIDAPGLRLTPSVPDSTIDRLDLWADPVSGVVLRVQGYQRGAGAPALSTSFLDFSRATPAPATTAFQLTPGARLSVTQGDGLGGLIRRYGPQTIPPATLAGVSRNSVLTTLGTVGVYGRGITEFAAAAISGRVGFALRTQLLKTPGVTRTGDDYEIAVGPVTLLLANPGGDRAFYLLAGTVTPQLLTRAATDLVNAQAGSG